jgi:predicted ATPase with chaperone activity
MERLALPGMVVEPVLNFMRDEGRIEVRRRAGDNATYYALTERGHAGAAYAMQKNTYAGPAPVMLDDYLRVVQAQSVAHCTISRDEMRQAFADLMLRQEFLDQMGPAMHSGRSVFFYGQPGTGKTYIGRRLVRLFTDAVLIPYAIAVRDIVVPFFDATIHQPVSGQITPSASLGEGYDARYVLCRRPEVVVGGELTLNMLEMHFDESRRQYRMPVQLLANNGLFMVDDLGRQRVSPAELLNRWIVPMEEKRDFLYISGQHFAVYFDVVLVFSTNLNPLELADEAFLRRLGYKICFSALSSDEYRELWQRVCGESQIGYRSEAMQILQELHQRGQVPLLPCHPRDLLNLVLDYCRYLGKEVELNRENLEWAWNAYFVQLN